MLVLYYIIFQILKNKGKKFITLTILKSSLVQIIEIQNKPKMNKETTNGFWREK